MRYLDTEERRIKEETHRDSPEKGMAIDQWQMILDLREENGQLRATNAQLTAARNKLDKLIEDHLKILSSLENWRTYHVLNDRFKKLHAFTSSDASQDLAVLRQGIEALELLDDSPYALSEATIPKAGVEANPIQVAGTLHVGYVKYQTIRKALAALRARFGDGS